MIGVLGGMGPEASARFYQLVIDHTQATCDQDHLDMLILSHASMPDRTRMLMAGRESELCYLLLEDAHRLQRAGCDALVCTCNTSHVFAHELSAALPIPFISMIESAVNGIKAHFKHGAKVAILATDGTIQRGLYQESLTNAGFVPYLPSPKCQEAVMHLIYDCVKAGQAVDTDAIQLIEQELAAQECAVPILGCTELSVIVDYFDGYCVDPMLALARAVINFEGRQFH